MSLNKPQPDLPNPGTSGGAVIRSNDAPQKNPTGAVGPDYVGLVSFLVKPFLESPDSLKVDCEVSSGKPRVWIRLAFEASDKGRVFGRGGRNIQAIRTLLVAAAQAVGQVAYLDVYGAQNFSSEEESEGSSRPHKSQSRRPNVGKPSIKPRSQRQTEE